MVGQAIASLPVSLGSIIKYTPRRDQPLAAGLDAVAACDFYALLLGTDIRAPVGSELHIARREGKRMVAFLKEGPRTPAAQVFAKDASLAWDRFRSADELAFLLQEALAAHILENAQAYSISPVDWETLSALLEELGDQEALEREEKEIPSEYRGAGRGGVIIAPGRDLPPGGVLVEKPEKPS